MDRLYIGCTGSNKCAQEATARCLLSCCLLEFQALYNGRRVLDFAQLFDIDFKFQSESCACLPFASGAAFLVLLFHILIYCFAYCFAIHSQQSLFFFGNAFRLCSALSLSLHWSWSWSECGFWGIAFRNFYVNSAQRFLPAFVLNQSQRHVLSSIEFQQAILSLIASKKMRKSVGFLGDTYNIFMTIVEFILTNRTRPRLAAKACGRACGFKLSFGA